VTNKGEPMALTTNDVRGIAGYARIALTGEELQEMTDYLNDALELLEPIRAYDLAGVEPTFHPMGSLANVTADDEPNANGRSLPLDVALGNAASTQGRAFRVPSILGEAKEGGQEEPSGRKRPSPKTPSGRLGLGPFRPQ